MPVAPPGSPEARAATREIVVGGSFDGFLPQGGFLSAQAMDDVVRQYGSYVYELMRVDPAVAGSLNLLFAGILAEGARVVSPLTMDPGTAPQSRRGRRELKLADEITAFWQDQISTVQPSFDQTMWELYDDACTGGSSLAEPVYRLEESGPYRGKYVLDTFVVKPRASWGMIVDPYLRVRKIRCLTTAGWQDVDRSHFVLMSWQPRQGDPRGQRILRPAYPAWNVKLQAIPDYAEYLKHFADPKTVLTAGPEASMNVQVDTETGARVEMTPQERLLAAAQQFASRSILALLDGDTCQLLYSQGNGEAYLHGFDWCDREIFRSIIIGARAMQEAKNSSKADTDVAGDLIGMAVQQSRKPGAEAIRNDLFYLGTLLNWGVDIADRFTPYLAFGVSDSLSPDLMIAFATAWAKGVFQPAQRPWMLAKLGAPQDPAPENVIVPQPPPGQVPGQLPPATAGVPDPEKEPDDATADDDPGDDGPAPKGQGKGKGKGGGKSAG